MRESRAACSELVIWVPAFAGTSGHHMQFPLNKHSLPAPIGNSPDRAVAVLADEQRAVARDRDADRPSPHRAIVDHEAGDKILVLAGGHAIAQPHADHLVAGALRSVPGTMIGGERVAPV